MSALPAYGIRSLTHAYDGNTVLDIPHFDIAAGQIWAFEGPNGCGKTTLFSILSLLQRPTSGSLFVFGKEAAKDGDQTLRGRVTLVHQKPVLFSTSARKNIAYGLEAKGLPSREIRQKVQSIVEAMNLSSVTEKHARKLSGGEAQRAVLARAMVLETPIILLDEPTNSLDEASKPILRALLTRARDERGATVLIATHDARFASSLADRIVRMESGKIFGIQETAPR
jgi:ABC-type multidrug transport system ATPase subunit